MEDPRGTGAAFFLLSLGGNRRPFNQTAEIEKQTRALIIQRRGRKGEKKGRSRSGKARRVAFCANSLSSLKLPRRTDGQPHI